MGDLDDKMAESVVRRQGHAKAALDAQSEMIRFLSDKQNKEKLLRKKLEKLNESAKDSTVVMNTHDAESEEWKKVLDSLLSRLDVVRLCRNVLLSN